MISDFRRFIALLAGSIFLYLSAAMPALAERRAFVVGLDTYKSMPKLLTAKADSRSISDLLKTIGFKVTLLSDPTHQDFSKAWQKFVAEVTGDDLVAVYFAGHGIQVDGVNYLLVRDTSLDSSDVNALKKDAISFHDMMEQLELKAPKASLYILDACRENPFAANSRSTLGQAKGLAKIESVFGSFVMYAAGPDELAVDKVTPEDKNSLFTRSLLPNLQDKVLSLVEATKRTQLAVEDVARKNNHRQRPAYFDGILGHMFLADADNPFRLGKPKDLPENERVFYLSRASQWSSKQNCRPYPPPKLKILNQPQYGRIVTRFAKAKVDAIVTGDAKCTGTEQRYLNYYYVIDEQYLGADVSEKFQVALAYDEAGNNFTRVLEFNANIKTKTSSYTVLRSR